MTFILEISRFFDRIARSIGKLVGWLMIPLIIVIMFDVITRKLDITRLYFSDMTMEYGFSVSTIVQDMEWHLHAAILLLSFGFGYLANAHVRVDVFRELLPRRQQAWLELLGIVFLAIPFLTLLIVYGYDLFAISWQQNEHSEIHDRAELALVHQILCAGRFRSGAAGRAGDAGADCGLSLWFRIRCGGCARSA